MVPRTKWFYAGWNPHWKTPKYMHFYNSRRLIELCGYAPENVHAVELAEAKPGQKPEYWGWEDSDKPRPDYKGNWAGAMIWASEAQMRMCFPYGLEAAIEHGHGRMLRLIVKTVDPAGDITMCKKEAV